MKKSKILIFLIVFFLQSVNLLSQCAGDISWTLSPVSTDNTYAPGSLVDLCVTMDGWNGNSQGSNWLEGFGLTLGSGWINVTPVTAPQDAGADASGTWTWMPTVTSASTGLVAGPGYFFEGPSGPVDGDTGNDWGDFCFDGLCTWEFCVTLEVDNSSNPLSLYIGVTPYADGTMGSWGNPDCNDTESPIFDGTIGCLTLGCTNPTACNFDPLAGCDDGSCIVSGCTDINACNYNPLAGCDDGSCTYPGCTDLNACNFEPIAGCDNGTCEYFSITDIVHQMMPCPDTVCIDAQVMYNVTGNLSSNYEWTISGGGATNFTGNTFCDVNWGSVPGQYILSAREITPSGCVSEWENCTIEVIIPNIDFDTTEYTICLNDIVPLSAQPVGGDWSSSYVSGSSFIGNTPGSHQVGYTAEIQGCTITEYLTVNVKPKFEHPTLIFGDTLVYLCEEPSVQLYSVLEEDGNIYTWTIDKTVYDISSDIFIEWSDTTLSYLISVWAEDTLGCVSEKREFFVKTESCTMVYAPNSFTPNNDGINDVFKISGVGIYEPRLIIANRWGDLFYQSDDIKKGWTGDNGRGYYSQDDVYTWRLSYRDYLNFSREIQGIVYLIR